MDFRPPKRRVKPVLQIISMIDLLIILLIFLIVTTTFRDSQSFLNVTLPKSQSLAKEGNAEVSRLGLIVTADERIFLGDLPVSLDNLQNVLRQTMDEKPGTKLELRIDQKVPFGTLIRVWESLKAAGVKVGEVPARVLKG